jgi:uncharacterized protein
MLLGEGSGHDWWHVRRVRASARKICAEEKADEFVVELTALLHDVADWKMHGGDLSAGPREARKWLRSLSVEEATIRQVCEIIETTSFKGAGVPSQARTIEAKIVQDADRLDAIGAIGIARAFAYGGSKGREIFNPGIRPRAHETFRRYKSGRGPSVNHFFEKLLLLKDLMNTRAGRRMATPRHRHMVSFLRRFFAECGDKPSAWPIVMD